MFIARVGSKGSDDGSSAARSSHGLPAIVTPSDVAHRLAAALRYGRHARVCSQGCDDGSRAARSDHGLTAIVTHSDVAQRRAARAATMAAGPPAAITACLPTSLAVMLASASQPLSATAATPRWARMISKMAAAVMFS
jgi:hypothetical protein